VVDCLQYENGFLVSCVSQIPAGCHPLARDYGVVYDNQIKHMGYRIELEEIEHALVRLPQIDQAAVLYQRSNAAYGKIVAFVSCKEAADEKVVLRDLAQLLPSYMIPGKLIIMEDLPKNPNGKVDRQKLKTLLNG